MSTTSLKTTKVCSHCNMGIPIDIRILRIMMSDAGVDTELISELASLYDSGSVRCLKNNIRVPWSDWCPSWKKQEKDAAPRVWPTQSEYDAAFSNITKKS